MRQVKTKTNALIGLILTGALLATMLLTAKPTMAEQGTTTLVFNKPLDTEVSRILIKRLTSAYRDIGVDIKIIDFDHKSSLKAANAGELDGQIGRIIGISNDYPNLIASYFPLMHLNLVLITNKGVCSDCKLKDLKTISHNTNYPFSQKYIDQENFQGEVIINNNLSSQIHMLRNHTIDGILVLEYLLTHQIEAHALDFFDKKIVSKKPIHHYLHKKHKVILDRLDEQLKIDSSVKSEHKEMK
ncbi:hypothetical protein [Pseudoalteromonas sp.]|uniref:hypothetical protein n=1 Tax=Pseudoalteromonas sp. TaxID=53249 RepID=UPI0035641627